VLTKNGTSQQLLAASNRELSLSKNELVLITRRKTEYVLHLLQREKTLTTTKTGGGKECELAMVDEDGFLALV
jgi:hypothetical protein